MSDRCRCGQPKNSTHMCDYRDLQIANLKDAIQASQAREAELLEKLESSEQMRISNFEQAGRWAAEATEAEKRAEAAEARINASQEQAILGTVTYSELRGYSFVPHPDYASIYRGSVYAQPPIQPELAELQRNLVEQKELWKDLRNVLESTQRENAELRKLLEESSADALRYRFLRRAWAEPAVLSALNEANPEPESDAEFDAAIDAAMLSAAPQPPKEQQ